MTKQEKLREVDKVLILATGKTGAQLDKVKRDLSDLGVVIRGESLGRTHPHLASYYIVESLIDKGGK